MPQCRRPPLLRTLLLPVHALALAAPEGAEPRQGPAARERQMRRMAHHPVCAGRGMGVAHVGVGMLGSHWRWHGGREACSHSWRKGAQGASRMHG